MSHEQQYIDLYKQHDATIKQHSAAALNVHRDKAFEQFCQLGFPNRKQEAYLYCPLIDDIDADYGLNIKQLQVEVAQNELFKCDVPGVKAHNFFVVNDQLRTDIAPKHSLPEQVVMCSLSEACSRFPEIVNRYLGQKTATSNDAFVKFNNVFAQNGYFLYVPKGIQLELPIQLINLLRSNGDTLVAAHNLIVLEEGASAKLLVCDHSLDEVKFFASRVTEVFVGERAQFDYYTLESTHSDTCNLSQVFIDQKASSIVNTDLISLHNGKTRNHIEIDLNGEHAETWLGGMVVADKVQKNDNCTTIRHNVPNCTSNELFKYILDGQAEGAFSGKILVEKDAQHTSAYQTNRNICLTKEATMHAKPQLEIYADDVKCGHGATTGQLDENALFYMRTRGIGRDEARMLLLLAFTTDILDHVAVEAVRDRLRLLVEQRLRGGNSKCKSCISSKEGKSCTKL